MRATLRYIIIIIRFVSVSAWACYVVNFIIPIAIPSIIDAIIPQHQIKTFRILHFRLSITAANIPEVEPEVNG